MTTIVGMRSGVACTLLVGVMSLCCEAQCVRKSKPDVNVRVLKEPITVPVSLLLGHAITRVKPAFPAEARTAKVDGTVVIALEIDHEGLVVETRPLSGLPLLQASAVAALQQWRFEPFCIKGVPYTVRSAVEFQFRWRGDRARLVQP